jgi:feruloyl-CoA synthase
VIVDWLPEPATFGGSHNFNLVRARAARLHRRGRPTGLIDRTIANLREVAPTVYFNVPRGYDMLVAALEGDALRPLFSRLQVLFYAAALPPHLWDALSRLARETLVNRSRWCPRGFDQTARSRRAAFGRANRRSACRFRVASSLVESGGKLEVRVKGPHVTPGYWQRPDLTSSSFDEEGFYPSATRCASSTAIAGSRAAVRRPRVGGLQARLRHVVNVGMLRVRRRRRARARRARRRADGSRSQ